MYLQLQVSMDRCETSEMRPWLFVCNLCCVCFILNISMTIAQNHSVCCKIVSDGYYDALYDLTQGVYRDFPGIETIQKFIGHGCSVKGVLKLTFNQHIATHQRMLIDVYLNKPQGWTFNVGDSITNNGWGGDAGTQSRDAELQFHDNTLSGFYNKFYDSGKAFGIHMNHISRLTCMVGNEFSVCFSDCNFLTAFYFRSPGWFALDGQSETIGPVNYDLYMGINGVVAMGRRVGSGVCKVGLKYVATLGN